MAEAQEDQWHERCHSIYVMNTARLDMLEALEKEEGAGAAEEEDEDTAWCGGRGGGRGAADGRGDVEDYSEGAAKWRGYDVEDDSEGAAEWRGYVEDDRWGAADWRGDVEDIAEGDAEWRGDCEWGGADGKYAAWAYDEDEKGAAEGSCAAWHDHGHAAHGDVEDTYEGAAEGGYAEDMDEGAAVVWEYEDKAEGAAEGGYVEDADEGAAEGGYVEDNAEGAAEGGDVEGSDEGDAECGEDTAEGAAEGGDVEDVAEGAAEGGDVEDIDEGAAEGGDVEEGIEEVAADGGDAEDEGAAEGGDAEDITGGAADGGGAEDVAEGAAKGGDAADDTRAVPGTAGDGNAYGDGIALLNSGKAVDIPEDVTEAVSTVVRTASAYSGVALAVMVAQAAQAMEAENPRRGQTTGAAAVRAARKERSYATGRTVRPPVDQLDAKQLLRTIIGEARLLHKAVNPDAALPRALQPKGPWQQPKGTKPTPVVPWRRNEVLQQNRVSQGPRPPGVVPPRRMMERPRQTQVGANPQEEEGEAKEEYGFRGFWANRCAEEEEAREVSPPKRARAEEEEAAKEESRTRWDTADAWHDASDGGGGWSSSWAKSWTGGWSVNDADGRDEQWARGDAAHSWDESHKIPHGLCWKLCAVDTSWRAAQWHEKRSW